MSKLLIQEVKTDQDGVMKQSVIKSFMLTNAIIRSHTFGINDTVFNKTIDDLIE